MYHKPLYNQNNNTFFSQKHGVNKDTILIRVQKNLLNRKCIFNIVVTIENPNVRMRNLNKATILAPIFGNVR
jgi:hypothetical protein